MSERRPRRPSVGTSRLRALVLVSLLPGVAYMAGCASGPLLKPLDTEPVLDVSRTELAASDDARLLSSTIVTVPGRVDTAAYDPALGLLVVGYGTDEDTGKRRSKHDSDYVAYDVRGSVVRWVALGRPKIERLDHGIMELASLVRVEDKVELYDAVTGAFIRESPKGLQFADPDGIALLHEYKPLGGGAKFSRIDVRTGEPMWEHSLCDYPRNAVFKDSWYYSVGLNCLDAFRLSDGQGWRLDVPTSNSGEATAGYAVGAMAGCLFGMVSPVTVLPTGSVIEHHFSPPLILGDRVYFAARDKLLCLGQETGAVIWETPLESDDYGSMSLFELDGDVYLVAEGWLRKNQYSDNAREPKMFRFSSETGELLSEFTPECRDYEVIRGVLPNEGAILVMTTGKVYTLDHDLAPHGTLESTGESGWFVSFVQGGDTPVARTHRGLLGFDGASLQSAWVYPIGDVPPEPEPQASRRRGRTAKPDTFALRWEAARQDVALSHDTESASWFWTPGTLYAFDRSQGSPAARQSVIAFPLGDDWQLEGFFGSAAVAAAGSRVMILDLQIEEAREPE